MKINENILNINIWSTFLEHGTNILIALIAFFGTTTGLNLLKNFKEKRERKKNIEEVYKEHINNVKVYRKLTELRNSTSFDKILIFEGKNSDTAGKPLTTYNIRCVQAACNDYFNEKEALEKFHNFKPDPHYRSILGLITEPSGSEILIIDTSSLPNGRLKEIYEAEGIKGSIIFLIGVTKKYHLIYGSASLYNINKNEISIKDMNELKITIDYLRDFM